MDNFTPEIDLQINRYLDNEMSVDENFLFQQQLKENQDLQEYIKSLQVSKEAIYITGLKNDIRSIHKEMMQEQKNETPVYSIKKRPVILRTMLAIAASVLLCVIGYQTYIYYTPSATNLYNEQFKSFELSQPRGAGISSVSPIEQAYRKKEFKQVTQLSATNIQPSVTDYFLTGLAYMELQQADKAIVFLSGAQQANSVSAQPLFKDDITYYLALAYLKNKNFKQAVLLMEQIHNDPNSVYQANFSDSYISKTKKLH